MTFQRSSSGLSRGEQGFFASACLRTGVGNADSTSQWFTSRQRAHRFVLREIPFSGLRCWAFDAATGNLRHDSGRFFSIEGIHVETNWGSVPCWDQPIINQPEIGILGFLTREMDGVLHFLVQAKMEPGNINMIQLAPTLQATRSNFTRVHGGRTPAYLEYFAEPGRAEVLVDVLQSEQGARFLRKRNRNMIVRVEEDVPVGGDFRWMTLGELHQCMRTSNMVNMDARTVLSCVTYDVENSWLSHGGDTWTQRLLRSFCSDAPCAHSEDEIIAWFTRLKFRYHLNVTPKALNAVAGWFRTDTEIRHESNRYFEVIAVSVEADNREVPSWTQPMIKAKQRGLIAFVTKEIDGVLHFLVQGKVEPGNFDIVEMAPTVQCITGSYEQVPPEKRPPFVQYVLHARPAQIRLDTFQSEEGGRFFREQNRNLILEADEFFPSEIPDNYIWMTAGQLNRFIKYNNFVNVQARCLLASLSFFEEE